MSTMNAKLAEFMCMPANTSYVREVVERMTDAGYEIRKRPATRAKSDKSPAEQFHAAFIEAKRNALEACPRWDLHSDKFVWIDVPPRLRTFRFKRPDGSLSIPIKTRRDHKAPAARYWPNGMIPAGVE